MSRGSVNIIVKERFERERETGHWTVYCAGLLTHGTRGLGDTMGHDE
jgi:hypothetical protein